MPLRQSVIIRQQYVWGALKKENYLTGIIKIMPIVITALLKCLPNINRSELPNHREGLEHSPISKANFILKSHICNSKFSLVASQR